MGRWHHIGLLLLALWVFLTPWVFADAAPLRVFTVADTVRQNFWMVAALIAGMASAAWTTQSALVEAGNGLLGAWLVVSPWVLGYAESVALAWGSVLTGVAIAVLAMLGLMRACRGIGMMRLR